MALVWSTRHFCPIEEEAHQRVRQVFHGVVQAGEILGSPCRNAGVALVELPEGRGLVALAENANFP